MSLVHKIDGVDVSSRLEFGTITDLTIAARGGEQGGGKIPVTDPSGTLNLRGWHSYTVDETDELTRPRLFTGRIAGKEIKRGPEGPIGAGRVWECDLQDLNTLAHMQLFRIAAAKRPPETNLARIAWALSTFVGSWIADTGYVNDADPRPFEEADYRQNYLDDVLDDVSGVIGRDWFPFWDYTATRIALFYNVRDAAILISPIYISNVAGDADTVITNATTNFAPGHSTDSEDVVVDRKPDEVYDGCLMVYAHGQEYVTRPATTATFFHDAPEGRDIVIENSRIGLPSTARSMAARYLDAHATEKDTIRIPWHVPATHVNHIAAGERIHVRLEHEPGYEAAYVTIRVARKTISEAGLGAGQMRWYDVMLECTDAAPANASGSGAPGPDTFPHPPNQSPAYIQHKGGGGTVNLPLPVADGELIVIMASQRGSYPTTPSGFTIVRSNTNVVDDPESGNQGFMRMYSKVASGETGGYGAGSASTLEVVTFPAGTTINATAIASAADGTVALTITPSAAGATVMGFAAYGATFDPSAIVPVAGTTLDDLHATNPPWNWSAYKTVPTPAATTISGTYTCAVPGHLTWGGIVAVLLGTAGQNPPRPGRWVGISPPESVVMSGVNGTTAYPFADGSLRVFYDTVEQTAAIVSYNGAAGTFVMPSAPPLGTQVFVQYQGR